MLSLTRFFKHFHWGWIQTTIFGFDRPDDFGDMMLLKVIINKGGNNIDDMYVGLWST